VSQGAPASRLEMILKSLDAARAHLASCEMACRRPADAGGQSVKNASVISGSVVQSIGVTAPKLATPNTNDVAAPRSDTPP
jgi:hypothetical protein